MGIEVSAEQVWSTARGTRQKQFQVVNIPIPAGDTVRDTNIPPSTSTAEAQC